MLHYHLVCTNDVWGRGEFNRHIRWLALFVATVFGLIIQVVLLVRSLWLASAHLRTVFTIGRQPEAHLLRMNSACRWPTWLQPLPDCAVTLSADVLQADGGVHWSCTSPA